MKNSLASITLALGLVIGCAGQASALNMHVPRSVIEAALIGPAHVDQPTPLSPWTGVLRALADRPDLARAAVIAVVMPGLMHDLGLLVRATPVALLPTFSVSPALSI
jgi:hypothetical protein